jgi:hypothetical protein
MAGVVLKVAGLGLILMPGMASGVDYSRYNFTYSISGGPDRYQGFVFAPTGFLTVGQKLYYEPKEMGGFSLDGGYYYITGANSGYGSSYDKQSYITSYYDPNLAAWLGVNSNASSTASSIYVANRSLEHESGYALSKGQPGYFDPFNETGTYSYSSVSRVDLIFYYTDGSGDYYKGYIYLSDNLLPSKSQYLNHQPVELGGGNVNGYYYFYNIGYGYAMSYNKKAYVTSYYDSSLARTLGVNSNGSTKAGSIYVSDRLADYEKGYAIYGSQVEYFDCYTSASY